MSRGPAECTRTQHIFQLDFLENQASNEQILFFLFHLFFRLESSSVLLYYQLSDTRYMEINNIYVVKYSFGRNICEAI